MSEKNIPAYLNERIERGKGCGSYILDGWYDIVIRLDEAIAQIDPHYKIDQIKEKFGGLRYYVSLSGGLDDIQRDHIYRLITAAEHKSETTCDVCGEPGTRATQGRGYIATRCDEHAGRKQ